LVEKIEGTKLLKRIYVKIKGKTKFSPEQATKAQRERVEV
jgi:hypothetical protein